MASEVDAKVAEVKDLRMIAAEISKSVQCLCDLDNWQPERNTGHSWVCPIHKAALAALGKEG